MCWLNFHLRHDDGGGEKIDFTKLFTNSNKFNIFSSAPMHACVHMLVGFQFKHHRLLCLMSKAISFNFFAPMTNVSMLLKIAFGVHHIGRASRRCLQRIKCFEVISRDSFTDKSGFGFDGMKTSRNHVWVVDSSICAPVGRIIKISKWRRNEGIN